jgi:lycopene beta-cyclase
LSTRLILVGGGLANSLIAWRLAERRPEIDLVVLERGETLGGNHVWSFHDEDLTPEQRRWIAPLIERSWEGYEVRFPRRRRTLGGGYHALTSDRLHHVVGEALGPRARTGLEVVNVDPRSVSLAEGSRLEAEAVVDGRGDLEGGALRVAFQKFVGQWIELESDHGLERPVLMDATIDQRDGFRFVYTLPFGERLVHVEDTRYSDGPSLDGAELTEAIREYVEAQGWRIRQVEREERGVLPIVLGGDIEAFWSTHPGVPRSGVRAALFHPTTGYSLPEAVRLADDLCGLDDFSAEALHRFVRERSIALWSRDRYFRLLNRMLFRAAEPHRRYRVLERFYGLPEPLIERFYAGRMTWADRVRVLAGRPPVPVGRALRCLFDETRGNAARGVSA